MNILGMKVGVVKTIAPTIRDAYLEEMEGDQPQIQLTIFGSFLSSFLLKQSSLWYTDLNLDDKLTSKDPTSVRLESLEVDKLVIAHELKRNSSEFETPIALPQTGHKIEIGTAFGKATFLVREFRLTNPGAMGAISRNEPVSMVIRKCLQRSITLVSIFKEDKTFELIADLIGFLASPTWGDGKDLLELWKKLKDRKDMASALTNDKSFEESMKMCKCIEEKLSMPRRRRRRFKFLSFTEHLRNAKDRLAKTGRSFFIVYPAALIAASSYLVQFLMAYMDYSVVMKVEQGYINCLEAVISSGLDLLKHTDSVVNSTKAEMQKLEMLKVDNNTYEMERMTRDVYRRIQIAVEAGVEELDEEEEKIVAAVGIVHQLRNTLVDTCFVGVVGLQNCGKSSLINRIWNVGAESGHTEKTTKPNVYRITDKFHVVDYPGSQSIDDHAATFAQSGIMNNLIIVILRYDGQVNKALLEEVQTALAIVRLSNGSAQVMFCINKADQDAGRLKRELLGKGITDEKPFDYMKRLHMTQLKDKLAQVECGDAAGGGRMVEDLISRAGLEDNYFFTSFTMDDMEEAGTGLAREARESGVIGVREVKGKIRDFLRTRLIYETEEELEACLRPSEH